MFDKERWRAAWPLALLIAITTVLHFIPDSTAWLRYERELVLQGQWHRLITANLVHTNHWHLLLNLSSIAVQWLLFCGLWRPRTWCVVAVVTTIGNIVGMHWFSPDTHWYVGMSGALYGSAVAGACALLLNREFLVGGVLWAYLNGRIVWEQFTGSPADLAAIIDAPVAIDAHLWGLVSGYLAVALLLLMKYRGTRL